MQVSYRRKVLRESLDLFSIAQSYGIEMHGNGKYKTSTSITEPSKHGKTNQTAFYQAGDGFDYQHWIDFSTDAKVHDVIDLIRVFEFNDPYFSNEQAYYDAMDYAEKKAGIKKDKKTKEFKQKNKSLWDKLKEFHSDLRNTSIALEYLYSNCGHSDEYINNQMLGFDKANNMLVFPVFDEFKNPIYWINRYFNPNPPECSVNTDKISTYHYTNYRRNLQGNIINNASDMPIVDSNYKFPSLKRFNLEARPLIGMHTAKRGERLIISEGTRDTHACIQEMDTYAVLSSGSCNFSDSNFKKLLYFIKKYKYKEIIISFDNDSAGIKAIINLGKKLIETGYYNISVALPTVTECKDIMDQFNKNNDIKEIFTERESFYSFLAMHEFTKTINNNFKFMSYEFEEFMKKPSRFLSNSQIEDIFSCIEKNRQLNLSEIDKSVLKEIKKTLKTKVIQSQIRDEVCSDHKLIYSDAIGTYEYNPDKGIFIPKSDTQIKKYVQDTLGDRFSGEPLESRITKTILTKVVVPNELELNYQNKLVLKNGTYNLDTDTLETHKFNNFATIALDYNFDPEADCPNFKRFVSQLMSENPQKVKVLQEALGYCLIKDKFLDVAFFFIGKNASNGKSTLMEIIRLILGVERITAVPMDCLTNPNYLYTMKNSWLNISGDEKTGKKSKDINSIFKMITSKDPITTKQLFKDPQTTILRTKFIFSSNDYLLFNSYDAGIDRRVVLIDFNESFVNNPLWENEHQKDVKLSSKLLEEAPGILNWLIEGKNRLLMQGEPSTYEGQEALKEEFKYLSENLYLFYDFIADIFNNAIKEYEEGKSPFPFIKNRELYNNYKSFCDSNGFIPKNSVNFSKDFSRVLIEKRRKLGEKWERCTYKNERGFKRIAVKTSPSSLDFTQDDIKELENMGFKNIE